MLHQTRNEIQIKKIKAIVFNIISQRFSLKNQLPKMKLSVYQIRKKSLIIRKMVKHHLIQQTEEMEKNSTNDGDEIQSL